MRELGEYIRQMRESQGVSLEEVAKVIKVNVRYLQALEEGQYNILPPEVYVKGFLRAYGEYLGIAPEELFTRYENEKPKPKPRFFSRKEPITIPATSPNVSAEPATKPILQKIDLQSIWQSIKAIPGVLYAFIVLVIVVGVVLIISIGNNVDTPETVTSAVLGDTTIQKAAAVPTDEDISQAIRIPIDSVNAAQALSVAESLTFQINAREGVRIYVEIDHTRKAFEGILKRGETKTWRVKNSIYLEVSNPSALRISVNGFELKPFEISYQQYMDINRQNILQLLSEGYIPPPSGVSSVYGQRIESSNVDTVTRPPTEMPTRRQTNSNTEKTDDTTSDSSSKPKIKPPRSLPRQNPPIQEGGLE